MFFEWCLDHPTLTPDFGLIGFMEPVFILKFFNVVCFAANVTIYINPCGWHASYITIPFEKTTEEDNLMDHTTHNNQIKVYVHNLFKYSPNINSCLNINYRNVNIQQLCVRCIHIYSKYNHGWHNIKKVHIIATATYSLLENKINKFI